MDQKQIISQLDEMLLVRYGCSTVTASPQQLYRALCRSIGTYTTLWRGKPAGFRKIPSLFLHFQIVRKKLKFAVQKLSLM